MAAMSCTSNSTSPSPGFDEDPHLAQSFFAQAGLAIEKT